MGRSYKQAVKKFLKQEAVKIVIDNLKNQENM